jgi:hypothetical protein
VDAAQHPEATPTHHTHTIHPGSARLPSTLAALAYQPPLLLPPDRAGDGVFIYDARSMPSDRIGLGVLIIAMAAILAPLALEFPFVPILPTIFASACSFAEVGAILNAGPGVRSACKIWGVAAISPQVMTGSESTPGIGDGVATNAKPPTRGDSATAPTPRG